MTTYRSRPLSKAKKLSVLGPEFHYVPSSNLNTKAFKKLEVKLNDNYQRILNYFSYDQSNTNATNNNNTFDNINYNRNTHNNNNTHNNHIKLPLTNQTEKNIYQQQQQEQSQQSQMKPTNYNFNKNIKLKLSSTAKEVKIPSIGRESYNKSFFNQLQNPSTIKLLFNSFLSKMKNSYPLIYPEFYSYCLLSSANPEIGLSEKETTKLFKNIFRKFYSKSQIKHDDLSHNTLFLSTIECLLDDYYHYITKSKSSFIQLFFQCYKEIIATNYGIFSRQIKDKLENHREHEEGVKGLKNKIEELNLLIFDMKNKSNLVELDNQNQKDIVIHQKNEIEGLKEEIEQLRNTIQIKNYEMNELIKKNEDHLKDNLGNNGLHTNRNNEFEEKLDLDKILKNRLERIKFNTFKKNVIFKNKTQEDNEDDYYYSKNNNTNFKLNLNSINSNTIPLSTNRDKNIINTNENNNLNTNSN